METLYSDKAVEKSFVLPIDVAAYEHGSLHIVANPLPGRPIYAEVGVEVDVEGDGEYHGHGVVVMTDEDQKCDLHWRWGRSLNCKVRVFVRIEKGTLQRCNVFIAGKARRSEIETPHDKLEGNQGPQS